MSIDLQTALIAATVALVTASITGVLTWQQLRRERAKWLFDLKTSISLELYKARMTDYTGMMKILSKLSRKGKPPLTIKTAQELAQEINDWMYSAGGLFASARTRNAGFAIRDILMGWTEGSIPREAIQVRDALIWSMKMDMDISPDSRWRYSSDTVLKQLQDEMDTFEDAK